MIRVLDFARSSRRRMAELVMLATLALAFAPAAYASGSSMPWETPLNSILESVQGPVAKIISVIIIVNRRRTGTPDRHAKGTPLWRWRASTLGTSFALLAT